MRTFGILGLIAGAIFAVVAFNMDVSVAAPMFGRVNNMGLMADRQNYLMMSIGLMVIGVLLTIFGNGKGSLPPSSTEVLRACPFCAESIRPEAIKCKHCGSDVPAIPKEQAELESIGAFFAKPDGMSIGEYQELFLEQYKVSRLASGFFWDGDEFNSFADLIQAVKSRST